MRGAHVPSAAFALLVGACLPAIAPAQRAHRLFAATATGVAPDSASAASSAPEVRFAPLSPPRRDSSWWVPLASTVLPGAGQALLGQDRFIAYLAVEAFGLLGFVEQNGEARRERERYRGLARDIARSAFPGNRPVGAWAYYETMEHYIESGVFDRFPGGEFSPEIDQSTANGALWLLARQTYWRSPTVEPDHASAEYRRAIAMYIDRAVRPEYRYSWRNAQLEQDLYRRSIARSNQAYRDATTQVAVLIANHLLSTVDAYVTLRLRGGMGAPGSPASLSASLPWAPFGRPHQWLRVSAK
jgi:hypothetical protein